MSSVARSIARAAGTSRLAPRIAAQQRRAVAKRAAEEISPYAVTGIAAPRAVTFAGQTAKINPQAAYRVAQTVPARAPRAPPRSRSLKQSTDYNLYGAGTDFRSAQAAREFQYRQAVRRAAKKAPKRAGKKRTTKAKTKAASSVRSMQAIIKDALKNERLRSAAGVGLSTTGAFGIMYGIGTATEPTS